MRDYYYFYIEIIIHMQDHYMYIHSLSFTSIDVYKRVHCSICICLIAIFYILTLMYHNIGVCAYAIIIRMSLCICDLCHISLHTQLLFVCFYLYLIYSHK